MTTIAYHHESKTIAWDSLINAGGVIKSTTHDKSTIVNDVRFWFAGCRSDEAEFLSQYFGKEPKFKPDCSCFVLDGGNFYLCGSDEDGLWKQECIGDDAMGSGCQFAIAAFDFGMTAKGAVEYAAKRDCYTGGLVREFKAGE